MPKRPRRPPVNHVESEYDERSGEISSRKAPKRKAAGKVAPSAATLDMHKFQSMFVEDVWDFMPDFDKLDPSQPVVVNEAVVKAVMARPAGTEECYRPFHPLEVYGEEQARPVVSSFIEGLVSLIGGEERVCVAHENPLRYFVKITDEDGTERHVEVSPSGEDARAVHEKLGTSLSHDERKSKIWKQDFVIFSAVRTLNEYQQETTVWIPRVNIEAKGEEATAADLLQASSSGWKLQLQRLQKRELIGRLYNEVWGTLLSFYCIQDIFGYLTVDHGRVTARSFERYQETVEKHRRLWGRAFPEESFRRCPNTLAAFQQVYDQKAREYEDTWKQALPSTRTVEDFPVGVVYFNGHSSVFPAGKIRVSTAEAARFIQGHVRVLAANWLIPTDPSRYEEANAKLLRNRDNFKLRRDRRVNEKLGLNMQIKELPSLGTAFKSLAEAIAGVSSESPGQASGTAATRTEVEEQT